MKRTGKIWTLITNGFLFILVGSLGSVWAQQVEVNATINETIVFSGERIILSVSVSGTGFRSVDQPQLPALSGLQYLSTNPSTSTNFSFINGVAERSYSYSYYLQTDKEGTFKIPQISVKVDGKIYKTDPISVTVKNRNKSATNSSSTTPDIFVRLELSNKTPFQGEQVIAELVLYFKSSMEVLSYQPVAGWKAEGFWKETLQDGRQPKAVSTIINNVRYRKATLLRYALFPTQTGDLELSPFEVICTVRYSGSRVDPFSSFFGGFGTNQRNVTLKSDPQKISVQTLPQISEGEFSGAVGNFVITRTVNSSQVFVGESIEIATKIKGAGNVAIVPKPKFEFPGNVEVYEPQEQSNINRSQVEISGEKIFTDIIIPRIAGKVLIPETTLLSYNPSTKRYKSHTLLEVSISVAPAPNGTQSVSQTKTMVSPALGLATWVTLSDHVFVETLWFPVLVGLGFVLLSGGFAGKKYLAKMDSDIGFARSNKASRRAGKKLDLAKESAALGNVKETYAAIHGALTGYIGDRKKLPESGLSDRDYIDALGNEISEDLGNDLTKLLTRCSTIRFAPVSSVEEMEGDIEKAQSMLKKLRGII